MTAGFILPVLKYNTLCLLIPAATIVACLIQYCTYKLRRKSVLDWLSAFIQHFGELLGDRCLLCEINYRSCGLLTKMNDTKVCSEEFQWTPEMGKYSLYCCSWQKNKKFSPKTWFLLWELISLYKFIEENAQCLFSCIKFSNFILIICLIKPLLISIAVT